MSNQELIEQQNKRITELVHRLQVEEKVNAMYSATYNDIIDTYKKTHRATRKNNRINKQIK